MTNFYLIFTLLIQYYLNFFSALRPIFASPSSKVVWPNARRLRPSSLPDSIVPTRWTPSAATACLATACWIRLKVFRKFLRNDISRHPGAVRPVSKLLIIFSLEIVSINIIAEYKQHQSINNITEYKRHKVQNTKYKVVYQ